MLNRTKNQFFDNQSRKKLIFFILICVLFIVLKIINLSQYDIISKDGVIYANLAKGFTLRGLQGALHRTFPPLYPVLMGLGSGIAYLLTQLFPQTGKIFNLFELSGLYISSLFFLLLCGLVFEAGRRVYDRKTAGLAALFMLFYPQLFRFSSEVLTETLFAFLLFAGVYPLLIMKKGGTPRAYSAVLCSGLAFGLSYYVKPEGIIIGLLFFMIFILTTDHYRKNLGHIALFFLLLAISVLPYMIYLYNETRHIMLTNKQNIVFYLSVKRIFPEWQNLEPTGALSFLFSHPVVSMKKFLYGLKYTIWNIPEAFFRIYFLFFLITFLRTFFSGNKASRMQKIIWRLMAIYFGAIAFYNPERRYFIPFVPLVAFDIARGFQTSVHWINKKTGKNPEILLLILILAVSSCKAIPGFDPLKRAIRTTGTALKDQAKNRTVASNDVRFAFYAEASHMTWEQLKEESARHGHLPDIIILHTVEDESITQWIDRRPLIRKKLPHENMFTLYGEKFLLLSKEKHHIPK